MIGYRKIPLYDGPDLSNIIDYIYVPIINREEAENAYLQTFSWQSHRGSNIIRHFGGKPDFKGTVFPYGLDYTDLGLLSYYPAWNTFDPGGLPADEGIYTSIVTHFRENFNQLTGPVFYSPLIPDSKFDFLRLMSYNQDLYLANGNYIRITKGSSDDVVFNATFHFYTASGSELFNQAFVYDVRRPTTAIFNQTNLRITPDTAMMALEAETSDRRYCQCSAASVPFLYDDMNGIVMSDFYLYGKRNRVHYVYSASRINAPSWANEKWLQYVSGYAKDFQGFWNRFLSITSPSQIEQRLEELNSEYVEYNESDDDNTYPGGGDDKNPYPPDGESGKGTFDNTNDPIDFPNMPTWDATSTGFISMWNPTITEITDLYSFLWDSDISTTLKKWFIEPMDAIISLAFFPVEPTNFPDKRNVSIGHVDTEIQMNAVQKQFVDFDFGSIKLDEYYGAAWDYSPYTKVSIYLPYIGSQELDVDDVMNATLHLKYRIDLLSGMCVAMLKCTRSRDGLDAIVYTWQGNCAMQVPITAGSARDILNSIIQLGAMTGLALVQPAAGAINAAMNAGDEDFDNTTMRNNWVNPTMAAYSALNVLGQKVHVQRGGRVDANAGVMSPQSAYIIIDRPVSGIPRGWNEYAGYPSMKVKALSTQKGFTQIAYIKLNGLEATADEISELDQILKGGVYL